MDLDFFSTVTQSAEIIPCHLQDGATPEIINTITCDLSLQDVSYLMNYDIARLKQSKIIAEDIETHIDILKDDELKLHIGGDFSNIQVYDYQWLLEKHTKEMIMQANKFSDEFTKTLQLISHMVNRFNLKKVGDEFVQRFQAQLVIEQQALTDAYFRERNSVVAGMILTSKAG